jgi:hypothetical protein
MFKCSSLKKNPLKTALFKVLFDAQTKKFNPKFETSFNNPHVNEKDTNKLSVNHEKTCGQGIFLSAKVEQAEAKTCTFTLNNVKYKMLLQCRCEPTHISMPKNDSKLYIVKGVEYVRPYGILIKEVAS